MPSSKDLRELAKRAVSNRQPYRRRRAMFNHISARAAIAIFLARFAVRQVRTQLDYNGPSLELT